MCVVCGFEGDWNGVRVELAVMGQFFYVITMGEGEVGVMMGMLCGVMEVVEWWIVLIMIMMEVTMMGAYSVLVVMLVEVLCQHGVTMKG